MQIEINGEKWHYEYLQRLLNDWYVGKASSHIDTLPKQVCLIECWSWLFSGFRISKRAIVRDRIRNSHARNSTCHSRYLTRERELSQLFAVAWSGISQGQINISRQMEYTHDIGTAVAIVTLHWNKSSDKSPPPPLLVLPSQIARNDHIHSCRPLHRWVPLISYRLLCDTQVL